MKLVFCAIVVGFGVLGFLVAPAAVFPKNRSITVRAHRYGYEPEVIRVNRGDTLRLRLTSKDVVHGFYLEGHNLDATIVPQRTLVERRWPNRPGAREMVEEVVLSADREGKFRYRCSQTCGFLHPFMLGELIVAPNRLLPTSLGLTVGILIGGLLVSLMRRASNS